MQFSQKIILFISGFIILSCSADKVEEGTGDTENPYSEITSEDRVPGIRIAWDASTRIQVSDENDPGYNGYARLIQLKSGVLLVAYESKGNIFVKKSEDEGRNWSDKILVANGVEGINMATPDVLELANGRILLAYNPRPGETAASSSQFLIRTVLSDDGGETWFNDQIVYAGATEYENGVWEPSAIQLPGGEIQLFFSNESVYLNSNEQNISLIRSEDNGVTWTEEPEIVSYRAGSRDGMPSPLFLDDQDQIIFSIEDNGSENQFKPYIIRNSISENWSQTVRGNDENRSYALKEPLEESEHAGAPYLARLKKGEVLLSYQGTENRSGNDLNNAVMRVSIGTRNATNFDRTTTPFLIPENKSGLWNSIEVLEDDSVVALTSTNAFSNNSHSEVWMIRGYVIPELRAETVTVSIDDEPSEDIWKQHFPVFIGHKGETQLQANILADENNLYVISEVSDGLVSNNSEDIQNNDGMVLYLDPASKSYTLPHTQVFKIIVSANNDVKVYEGNNSDWIEIEMPEMEAAVFTGDNGYSQEIAIPWNSIGGKPNPETQMGFTMELLERGNDQYSEMLSTTQSNAPNTWLSLKL